MKLKLPPHLQAPAFSTLSTLFPHHPILSLLLTSDHHSYISTHAFLSYSITSGLVLDPFFASRLVQHLLRINFPRAEAVFQSIPYPDVYTWNLMVSGSLGRTYYFRMRAAGAPPNSYTFALLVRGCMVGGDGCGVGSRRMVHGQVLKCGAEVLVVVRNSLMCMYCNLGLLGDARLLFDGSCQLDLVSYNTMISAYGKNGEVGFAREMFDVMPQRNLVSWSAMIDGYVRSGESVEALRLFGEMQAEGWLRPDVVTLVSVLKACAHLGALEQGVWVHVYVERNGMAMEDNVVLLTALINMYCKCGCVDAAVEIFNGVVSSGDVVLWNAMIGGLAMHGHAKDALNIFLRMRNCGIVPNETTFIAVLCACNHAGMVQDGIGFFKSMKKDYGFKPWREHYGCLTDLLGRAGLVEEAEKLLLSMPVEPQASQWGTLMSACQVHNNIKVGERVGKRLIALEPEDGGRYVSLSNVYASSGRREDARETRKKMEAMGIKKETGCSFIECNGVVHEFIVGDRSHPQIGDVYVMLREVERASVMAES